MEGVSDDQQHPPAPHDRDCDDPASCIADLLADDGRDEASRRYMRRQALRYIRSVEDRLSWAVKSTTGCHAAGLSEDEVQWIRAKVKRDTECTSARRHLLGQLAVWAAVSIAGLIVLALALGIAPAIRSMLPGGAP